MTTVAQDNETTMEQTHRLIDLVIALKNRCNLEERIGERYGLPPREVAVIFRLKERSMTSKELSAGLGVSTSRCSRIIGGLFERGLLEVAQAAKDRRSSIISLSPRGKACLQDLEEVKDQCERDFTGKLEQEQIDLIRRSMDLLLKVV